MMILGTYQLACRRSKIAEVCDIGDIDTGTNFDDGKLRQSLEGDIDAVVSCSEYAGCLWCKGQI